MHLKLQKLDMAGDTIIEVLVVLAVLGLAIGISYATANRSLLSTRGAQENSQATELLQSQIEQLRASASQKDNTQPDYIYQGSSFCMESRVVRPSSSVACTIDGRYSIVINYLQNPTGQLDEDKFILKATWDDVQGQGTDSITMVYRVHP